MKSRIYYTNPKTGELYFYLRHDGKRYYLFHQPYRKSVCVFFDMGFIWMMPLTTPEPNATLESLRRFRNCRSPFITLSPNMESSFWSGPGSGVIRLHSLEGRAIFWPSLNRLMDLTCSIPKEWCIIDPRRCFKWKNYTASKMSAN